MRVSPLNDYAQTNERPFDFAQGDISSFRNDTVIPRKNRHPEFVEGSLLIGEHADFRENANYL